MDFTTNIFTRLQNGENVEDIAAELTKSINEANEKYKAEQAIAEEARAERSLKMNAIKTLLDGIREVLVAWDLEPEFVEALKSIDADDIFEMVDGVDKMMPLISQYVNLQESFADMFSDITPKVEVSTVTAKPHVETAKDPVKSFLDEFVNFGFKN